MFVARFTVLGIFSSAVLFAGCSRDDGPELGAVSGRVSIEGKPFSNVRVVFSLGHSRPSSGITDSEGRYELSYTVSRKGALPGLHKVAFYKVGEDGEPAGESMPRSQPELVREVKSGANVFDFELR